MVYIFVLIHVFTEWNTMSACIKNHSSDNWVCLYNFFMNVPPIGTIRELDERCLISPRNLLTLNCWSAIYNFKEVIPDTS